MGIWFRAQFSSALWRLLYRVLQIFGLLVFLFFEAALFGVGYLLLRSAAVGIGLLVISALAAAAIARNLR
jgi:hypothetical protein